MQENNFKFQQSLEVNGRRVRVLQEVGQGSFGVKVFLGKTQDKEYVALKMIPAHPPRGNNKCLPFSSHWCCNGERQTAMKVSEEIKIMERFTRAKSRNILAIRDSQKFSQFMGQKCHFIVMDYAQHLDLFYYIDISRNGISPKIVFTIVREVAKALRAIHSLGFIHADVKPENIMLDANFIPKLTDFDYSCSRINGRKLHGGTPIYAAPEIFFRKDWIDTSVDIWALGVSLLVLLTARYPFGKNPCRCERYSEILSGYWFGFWSRFGFELPQEHREIIQFILQPNVCHRPTSSDLLGVLTYGNQYSTVPCPDYYEDLQDAEYQQEMRSMYLKACKKWQLKSFKDMTANENNFDAGKLTVSPTLADPAIDEVESKQGSFDKGEVALAGSPDYEMAPPVIEALSTDDPEVEKPSSKPYRSPMSKLKRCFSFGFKSTKKDASSKKERKNSMPSLSFKFPYKKTFRRKKNNKRGSKSTEKHSRNT